MSVHAEHPASHAKASTPKESSVIGTTVKDAMWSFGGAIKRVVFDDLGQPVKDLKEKRFGKAAIDVPLYALGGSILDICEGVAGSVGAVLGVGFDKKIAKDGLSALWKNSMSPIRGFKEGRGFFGKIGKSLLGLGKDAIWGNIKSFLKPITAFNLRTDAGLTGLAYKGLVALAKATAPASVVAPHAPAAPAAHQDHGHAATT